MTFKEKWLEAVQHKNSLLCVNIDPTEPGQKKFVGRADKFDKFRWCLSLVDDVAAYASAIKINRCSILDFSRDQTSELVHRIHAKDMLAIDDSKFSDIGASNDAAFFHCAREGFNATTYSPFAGNLEEAVRQAHSYGIGLISLLLMSNPEFDNIKHCFRKKDGRDVLLEMTKESDTDGIVVAAPSARNHISQQEILKISRDLFDRLVLVPGMGVQAGEARFIVSLFLDNAIVSIGRSITDSRDPGEEAKKFRDYINTWRNVAQVSMK